MAQSPLNLYGSIIGVDSAVKQLKYGRVYALTGYLSYNGANLKYKGINANQNGAILGSTLTLYPRKLLQRYNSKYRYNNNLKIHNVRP